MPSSSSNPSPPLSPTDHTPHTLLPIEEEDIPPPVPAKSGKRKNTLVQYQGSESTEIDKPNITGKMTAEIKKLAMIGCGAMGGGMALLFAENGCDVLLQDPSNEAMDKVLAQAEKDGVGNKVSKYQDYASMCRNLGTPKVFVWSLPHGDVGDKVLAGLMPFLEMGDIIIDAANEHWENTERRIGKCVTKGIRYVGMGVSGGYQAA